jgi:hypothetical protein
LLHFPQCSRFRATSVHTPLQIRSSGGHKSYRQSPRRHGAPKKQSLPHCPQFFRIDVGVGRDAAAHDGVLADSAHAELARVARAAAAAAVLGVGEEIDARRAAHVRSLIAAVEARALDAYAEGADAPALAAVRRIGLEIGAGLAARGWLLGGTRRGGATLRSRGDDALERARR